MKKSRFECKSFIGYCQVFDGRMKNDFASVLEKVFNYLLASLVILAVLEAILNRSVVPFDLFYLALVTTFVGAFAYAGDYFLTKSEEGKEGIPRK